MQQRLKILIPLLLLLAGLGQLQPIHRSAFYEFEAAYAPVDGGPEPAAWALMIAGCGVAGAMMRRSRKTALA